MKRQIRIFVLAMALVLFSHIAFAQQQITIVTPMTEVSEGLDLYAVAELFKDCKNLEEFEAALNDPDIGVNNLDLDRDGYVDYIRVVEQVVNYKHVILLQVLFRANEFHDIAAIEIERTGYDDYRMHIRGGVMYYGPDYYFSFGYTRAYHWPIITWIFSPFYRPYRSIVYFGYYPHWWRPYRHVTVYEYRHRNPGHSWREAFYRNRPDRAGHDHRDRHFTDQRNEKHSGRNYDQPRPDRSHEYGYQSPSPREERRSANPRMRIPDQNDNDRERNNANRPDIRKNGDIRKEARQSDRPAVVRTPDSRGDESKTVRQREERRSTGDQDNRRSPVREKRLATR